MKIPIDKKFFFTASATFLMIVVGVLVLNIVAGAAVAGIGGAVLAAIAVKLFDKLDFSPEFTFEPGAPKISAPWIYALLVSILIVSGSGIGVELILGFWKRFYSIGFPCSIFLFIIAALLEWGGLLLSGFLIGRVFPKNALSLSSISAFLFFVENALQPDWGLAAKKFSICFDDLRSQPDLLEAFLQGAEFSYVPALLIRGYIIIVVARIASKKQA